MKILLYTIFITFLIHYDLAADSTFRCDGGIVTLRDTKFEVSAKCGEPNQSKSWEEGHGGYYFQFYDYEHERYFLPKLIRDPLRKELWIYDLGPNRFIRNLFFQNGELIRIETGEKGGSYQ